MNLEDALGSSNNQPAGHGPWPGQPAAHPAWPESGGGSNPIWNAGGGNSTPAWLAGGGNSTPGFPSPGPQPSAPGGWAGPPSGPGAGGWAGPPAGPGAGGWAGPPAGPGPGPGPAMPFSPQQSLAVPYSLNLPHGVYDKLLITINGTIKDHPDRFMVDLHTRSGDLAFHFNPRFNENGRKVIVRNTCINKKWGKEERDLSRFPFVQGRPFEMKIMCTNAGFKVAVDNSHLLDYSHRIRDLTSITKLNIINDVILSRVHMENMP